MLNTKFNHDRQAYAKDTDIEKEGINSPRYSTVANNGGDIDYRIFSHKELEVMDQGTSNYGDDGDADYRPRADQGHGR